MHIKLKNGRVQRYSDAGGRILVARGIGVEVTASQAGTYQTRMLTAAAPAVPVAPAPIEQPSAPAPEAAAPAAEAEGASASDTAPATTVTPPAPPTEAPYGYKADGTPRKRPGRPTAKQNSEDK